MTDKSVAYLYMLVASGSRSFGLLVYNIHASIFQFIFAIINHQSSEAKLTEPNSNHRGVCALVQCPC